jgi:hypothetical protein
LITSVFGVPLKPEVCGNVAEILGKVITNSPTREDNELNMNDEADNTLFAPRKILTNWCQCFHLSTEAKIFLSSILGFFHS